MRPFTTEPGFTDDFFQVRDFLVRINADRVRTPGFLWSRWEWAFTLPFLDTTALGRIGVWEQDGRVVGLVTFEEGLGDAWLVVDPARRDLLPEMVDHAMTRLSVAGSVRVMMYGAVAPFDVPRTHSAKAVTERRRVVVPVLRNSSRVTLVAAASGTNWVMSAAMPLASCWKRE